MVAGPELLPRAISKSMVLLQLGSCGTGPGLG